MNRWSERATGATVWDGFTSLQLGDMVHLPGEGPQAVRLLATFGEDNREQFFCVLGDVERVLLGKERGEVVAYVPVDQLPARLAAAKVIAEGRAGYLAANAPHSNDALDAMPWRVVQLAGHLHPLVLLYRGPQLLVFLPAGALADGGLRVIRLPRKGDAVQANRVTALVDLPNAPVEHAPAVEREHRSNRLRNLFVRN